MPDSEELNEEYRIARAEQLEKQQASPHEDQADEVPVLPQVLPGVGLRLPSELELSYDEQPIRVTNIDDDFEQSRWMSSPARAMDELEEAMQSVQEQAGLSPFLFCTLYSTPLYSTLLYCSVLYWLSC